MAFMMPVMKKNYALYGNQQRQRRTSSETDGRKVALQTCNSSASMAAHQRRKVRSEGPSLSTSPAAVGSEAMTAAMQHRTALAQAHSKPIGMRRGRGSAPTLAPSASLHHHSSSVPLPVSHSSVPSGTSPAPDLSPSRSTSSSSTSSGSTGGIGRFHTKLVARLRKSFRMKDPEPTTS